MSTSVVCVNLIFGTFRRQNIVRGCIDTQVQIVQLIGYLLVCDGIIEVCQFGTLGNRTQTRWKLTYLRGIVIFLNMLTAASNSHSIQHLEEVKRKHIEQFLRGALLGVFDFRPRIILGLSRTEDIFNRTVCIQLVVNQTLITLISQLQLVLQVVEAVVYRCGRKHQHFGSNASTNHLVHQSKIAVLAWILIVLVSRYLTTITEVMALVNHYQVVVAPIQTREIYAIRQASITAEVCMKQHIIAQTVFFKRIVLIVALICIPVLIEFFRAEHQYALIAVLVILDDRNCRKGLTQTDRVSQDTTIIGLQLVDDGQSRILLEVIELIPYLRTFETRSLIGQHILADILQELIEDIIERDEIDEVWRVLTINIFDVLYDSIRHVGQLFPIHPQVIEILQVCITNG